jgi:hypothetical protein
MQKSFYATMQKRLLQNKKLQQPLVFRLPCVKGAVSRQAD